MFPNKMCFTSTYVLRINNEIITYFRNLNNEEHNISMMTPHEYTKTRVFAAIFAAFEIFAGIFAAIFHSGAYEGNLLSNNFVVP